MTLDSILGNRVEPVYNDHLCGAKNQWLQYMYIINYRERWLFLRRYVMYGVWPLGA